MTQDLLKLSSRKQKICFLKVQDVKNLSIKILKGIKELKTAQYNQPQISKLLKDMFFLTGQKKKIKKNPKIIKTLITFIKFEI